MAADWVLRLALAAGLLLLGWALYRLAQQASLRRAGKLAATMEGSQGGLPTIIYFTTPDCVACKVAQRPALQRLREMMADRLQIIEVDAYEKPELAKQWGVLSVPTTFILNEQGQPRQVNYGVTPADKLYAQIHAG